MSLAHPGVVERAVSNILVDDDWKPTSEEDYSTFLPRAKTISDMRVPLKYWLEQPCPARPTDQDAPCIAIRRGVHEFLLETRPEYAAKQSMLRDLGYVELGANFASFRIGHRAVQIRREDGAVAEIPAAVWAVEGFTLDGEHY